MNNQITKTQYIVFFLIFFLTIYNIANYEILVKWGKFLVVLGLEKYKNPAGIYNHFAGLTGLSIYIFMRPGNLSIYSIITDIGQKSKPFNKHIIILIKEAGQILEKVKRREYLMGEIAPMLSKK